MRLFAFFLPQFHEIPENDEWWGKGFTEWTKVKAAKPLFKGHIQPKHPVNGNYYDLLNRDTVVWQTTLMKKYGLDGMIYYHYYFNGKLMLEKPAENLLSWKDIDQPFFFCWANHDWNRSWEGKKEILLKQEYGDQADWEQHFQYLLPFFKDIRYEKKDNMPLFMLFKSNFIEMKEMVQYFDKRCKDYGFDGLYLIETFFGGERVERTFSQKVENYKKNINSVTKNIFLREPNTSEKVYHYTLAAHFFPRIYRKIRDGIGRIMHDPYLYKFSGNQFYREMIARCADMKAIHGIFFEWDNTPRHGKRGYVITPVSKKLFWKYMDKIRDDEYVFINAWNEWAEGMVLEPTEENGYRYLEWIQEWRGGQKRT